VKRLRDSLQDSAESPRYIETLARRGYRFIAPVSCEPERASQPEVPPLASPPATLAPELHVHEEAPALTRRRPPKIAIGVALSLVVPLVGLGLFLKRRADRKWAHESAPRVGQLATASKYSEAYELATQVLARDPSELRVSSLMPELSDDLSVSTKPAGAEVYLRRLGSAQPVRVGVTPIDHLQIAHAEYILSIRKAGYADFERTVSSALQRTLGIVSKKSLEVRTQQELRDLKGSAVPPLTLEPWEIRIQLELREASKLLRGMIAIPGGARSTSRELIRSALGITFFAGELD